MRLVAILLLTLYMAGCAQLVEVRSNRGEMDLVEYRGVVAAIDEQLKELDFVSGARISMSGDRTTVVYSPSESISTKKLRQVVLELYYDHHQEHPFAIEAVEIVSARSHGVRVDR